MTNLDKNDVFKIIALIMVGIGLFILNDYVGQQSKKPRYIFNLQGAGDFSYIFDTTENKIYTRVLLPEKMGATEILTQWQIIDLPIKSKTTSQDWAVISTTSTTEQPATNNNDE